MILIAGGAFQGKLEFAKALFQERQGREPLVADGASCSLEEASNAEILCQFHEYVRRFGAELPQADVFAGEWAKRSPRQILVTNELGYGVVPVDTADRAWRERCGRLCTALAGHCEEVYRVVCGIGMRLK